MTLRICAVCRSDRLDHVSVRAGLEYDCCKACGHCLMRNVDSSADAFEIAQDKYYGEGSVLLAPGALELESLARRYYTLDAKLAPNSRVLEVGPGSGHVADHLLSRGHSVTAVEHSPTLAEQLSHVLGRDSVILHEFERLDLPSASFDAFCTFHVIEHVTDPLAHLVKAHELVKPGGLAFVATPNSRSLEQRLFRKLSPNFDSAHLAVFSPQSLRMLSERSGWTMVEITTPEYMSSWLRVATKLMRRAKDEDEEQTAGKYAAGLTPRMKRVISLAQTLSTPVRTLQAHAGLGNELLAVLRKP